MVPLFIFGLIVVNYWHLHLAARYKNQENHARSVSELALATKDALTAHKFIHAICALIFMYYGAYLLENVPQLALSGLLLILAGMLDIIQALVLSKKTVHLPGKLSDPHQATAWLMAVLYLIASVTLLVQVGLGNSVAIVLVAFLGLVTLWLKLTHSKHFLAGQMLFFVSVSVALVCGAVAGSLIK